MATLPVACKQHRINYSDNDRERKCVYLVFLWNSSKKKEVKQVKEFWNTHETQKKRRKRHNGRRRCILYLCEDLEGIVMVL